MPFAPRSAATSIPNGPKFWGHIYMGKIYDILGQRERAVNEYNLAQHLKDDTAGAQAEAARYLRTPYNPEGTTPPATATASGNPAQVPAGANPAADPNSDKQPTLKKRTENN